MRLLANFPWATRAEYCRLLTVTASSYKSFKASVTLIQTLPFSYHLTMANRKCNIEHVDKQEISTVSRARKKTQAVHEAQPDHQDLEVPSGELDIWGVIH